MSIIACPSLKSLIHPTFGHMFGSFAGTEQNFVYTTACETGWSWTLKPSCSSCDLTTCDVLLPGGTLVPIIVIVQCAPEHFPSTVPLKVTRPEAPEHSSTLELKVVGLLNVMLRHVAVTLAPRFTLPAPMT